MIHPSRDYCPCCEAPQIRGKTAEPRGEVTEYSYHLWWHCRACDAVWPHVKRYPVYDGNTESYNLKLQHYADCMEGVLKCLRNNWCDTKFAMEKLWELSDEMKKENE